MDETPAFNLASAMDAWRMELSLRDALHPPAQAELTERMTAMLHEFIRQGYSEEVAFAMAKEAAGGDHGDAMAALWRMRKLAKWEAARWMMTGVVAMLIFQFLSNIVYQIIMFALTPGSGKSTNYSFDWIRWLYPGVSLILTVMTLGLSYLEIRLCNFWFPRFWRWLPRWLPVTILFIGLVNAIVGFILYKRMDVMVFQLWDLALAGFCFLIHLKIRNFERGIKSNAFPTTTLTVRPPPQGAWRLMLIGLLLLLLMSYGVSMGLNAIATYLRGSGEWIFNLHSLMQTCLMTCLGCLVWFIADVPIVQRVGRWWLQRPWRSLLFFSITLVLVSVISEITLRFSNPALSSWRSLVRADVLFTLVHSLPFPILLILWMKWSAKRDSRGLL